MILTVMLTMLMWMQVFEHEATVRLMAGASPARNFERHNNSTLRRRHHKLSAAITADRLRNTIPGIACVSVNTFNIFRACGTWTLVLFVLG